MINEIAADITFAKRDEFGRKVIAEKIIALLASDAQVSPMIIDGGWGTGKTEFCKKLINLIAEIQPDFNVVYIDAFRYDNNSEPLLAVLSSILKILPDSEQVTLIEKALPAIKFGIKTTLKAGVSWVLKQDAIDIADDFAGDLKSAGDAAANYAVETVLKDHMASQDNIDLLIKTLTDISDKKPIIIVIDELDRCRPDYSVSMLEYIKHIFNVNNIQFILVTNTEQLKSSVNHSYGASINAQKYLDKFVSYSFTLPQMINHNEGYVSVVHMQGLLEASKVLKSSLLTKQGIFELIETLIKVNHLSLREVETFARYLEIYQIVTENRGLGSDTIFGFGLLRVLSVFIFCFHGNKAETLSRGSIDCLFISDILGTPSLLDLKNSDRASINDTLVAIFRIESNMPAEEFEASYEKNREVWGHEIQGLFSGSGVSLGRRGTLLKILTDAIYALKLS